MKILVEKHVECPMRDGTVLRTDLYRPEDGERHPVLLMRTPYNKDFMPLNLLALDPLKAAAAGYVVAIQDVRGRWASEGGPFAAYEHERADGADAVAWAAGLPCGDGTVAMHGVSYLGGSARMAAAAQPSALRALGTATAPEGFHETHWRGGALQWGLLARWGVSTIGPNALLRAHAAEPDFLARFLRLVEDIDGFDPTVRALPLADFAPARPDDPAFLPFLFEILRRPTPDAWTAERLVRPGDVERMTAPALVIAGWHDLFVDHDLAHFAALRERGGSEEVRTRSKLVVGPWAHASFLNVVGDLDFGLRASGFLLDLREDLTALQLRWFDQRVKGRDTGIDGEPPVKLFVMGRNRWRDEDGWPLARAKPAAWHLGAGGALSPRPPDGDEAPDSYRYDPDDPCPTTGGNLLLPLTYRAGPLDQRRVMERPDVLAYVSEPLTADLEVTGVPTAVLYAASSAPDTDWVVKLCDAHPDGRVFNVCDGILRARYRHSPTQPALLEPDAVERYEIPLHATSEVFAAGHRLVLLVTSSDFPRYDRNPNTGELSLTSTTTQPARQLVFHDPERPSHVLLPVVEG